MKYLKKNLALWAVILSIAVTSTASAQTQSQRSADIKLNTEPLSYLHKYTGKDPWPMLKTQPLNKRLRALLGSEYSLFSENLTVAGFVMEDHGVIYVTGLAPHGGGSEESVLLIDTKQNLIEAIVLHDSELKCVKAENNHAVYIPVEVQNTLQAWPQDVLANALARLSK